MKLLKSMSVGTERIREIVLSLRNFSRLDESEFKAVDIHEGIDSTLMILHNRLREKPDGFSIQIIREYGPLPLVECYAGQLNQVFMNLLSNAIDALEERDSERTEEEVQANPSFIHIRTELLPEQSIKIWVSDNGPGIPEAIQAKLFDPFFTTKPIGQGTGLGLSISYQIIAEKHKGKLSCHSIVGKGAKFLIELPINTCFHDPQDEFKSTLL
jgi:signal transduction histidine kinase